MNRIVKINNFMNPISSKDIEFKINNLYKNNEIIPVNSFQEIHKICRICLEEDDEEYISPCLCKGTQKYIHRECLNKWRNMHPNNTEKRNSCEICKYKFKFFNRNITDYSKYFIKMSYHHIIHSMCTWFIAIMFIWTEITSDFFVVRTLNFYNYNNSKLLNIFRKPEYDNILYVNYILFYLPLSFFLLEIYYLINFYLKCNKIFKNLDYKIVMKSYVDRYIIQSCLFLYYYYLFLIINDLPYTYLYSNFCTILFNLTYRLNFLKKHNEVIGDIIYDIHSNEIILSFEENPLLNSQNNEITEKKAQDINAAYLSDNEDTNSNNSSDTYTSSNTSNTSIHSNEAFFNQGETKNFDIDGTSIIFNHPHTYLHH